MNKVAVVTGAARSLGKAYAEVLHSPIKDIIRNVTKMGLFSAYFGEISYNVFNRRISLILNVET